VPLLSQVAELGGPIAVGLVLLGANLALAKPILARLEKRPMRRAVLAGGAAALVSTSPSARSASRASTRWCKPRSP